ncbi:hypothetical protein SLE2022_382970 [Rubroshorea leprosula]
MPLSASLLHFSLRLLLDKRQQMQSHEVACYLLRCTSGHARSEESCESCDSRQIWVFGIQRRPNCIVKSLHDHASHCRIAHQGAFACLSISLISAIRWCGSTIWTRENDLNKKIQFNPPRLKVWNFELNQTLKLPCIREPILAYSYTTV